MLGTGVGEAVGLDAPLQVFSRLVILRPVVFRAQVVTLWENTLNSGTLQQMDDLLLWMRRAQHRISTQ